MGRPRLHDDSTRRNLLREAETLVTRGGTDAVSVRTLAASAGTTTRAVYSLFGSIEGVFSALYGEAYLGLIRQVDSLTLTGEPRSDLIRICLDGFRRWALAHPNLFRLAFERVVPNVRPRPEDRDAGLQALRRLEALVRACADAGRLDGRSVEAVVAQVSALCQGLASMELRDWWAGTDLESERLWEDALNALLDGLEARVRRARAVRSRRRPSRARRGSSPRGVPRHTKAS